MKESKKSIAYHFIFAFICIGAYCLELGFFTGKFRLEHIIYFLANYGAEKLIYLVFGGVSLVAIGTYFQLWSLSDIWEALQK